MPWSKVDGKRRYFAPPPIGRTVNQRHADDAKRMKKVFGFVPADPTISRQQRRLFLRQMGAGLHVG